MRNSNSALRAGNREFLKIDPSETLIPIGFFGGRPRKYYRESALTSSHFQGIPIYTFPMGNSEFLRTYAIF